MSLATVADLEKYLGVTGLDPVRAQFMLDQSTAIIQAYTEQHLLPVTDHLIKFLMTEPVDRFNLPEVPVTTITTLVHEPGSTYPTDYVTDENYAVQPDSGVVYALPLGAWFPHGLYEVTFSHGFDPTPDALVGVCCSIAARMTANPGGVKSESVGSYSVSYGDAGSGAGASAGPGTGLAWGERLVLDKYRQTVTV